MIPATINPIPSSDRFQILALDGGGIKGLYSAAVLAKLEEKLQVRIVDHFDLITGTSTGGLIAVGLGLGMRPREIVQFYIREGPRIFSNTLGWRWCLHWFRRKYPQHRLKSALTDSGGFGDRLLGDSSKRLVIPAYNINQDKVRIFKTPHHERLTTDWSIPAWKVALATSAAPTYFESCCDVESARLIDGGVWANNPTVVGIAEAVSMLGRKLNQIHVLNIGTTDSRKRRTRSLRNGGILQWLRGRDVIEVLMRGQSVGTHGLAQHLVGPNQILRIDPIVPDGIYHLDRVNADDLVGEAEDSALHHGPEVKRMFVSHQAPSYTPLHFRQEARHP